MGGREVLDRGQHLDWRRGGRLQVRRPAERHAGEAAERVVGEPAGAAADREQSAELGVHQRQQDYDECRDRPADQGRRAGDGGRDECTEQPPRPDHRAHRRIEEAQEADLSVESFAVEHNLLRRCGDGQCGDGNHQFVPRSRWGVTRGAPDGIGLSAALMSRSRQQTQAQQPSGAASASARQGPTRRPPGPRATRAAAGHSGGRRRAPWPAPLYSTSERRSSGRWRVVRGPPRAASRWTWRPARRSRYALDVDADRCCVPADEGVGVAAGPRHRAGSHCHSECPCSLPERRLVEVFGGRVDQRDDRGARRVYVEQGDHWLREGDHGRSVPARAGWELLATQDDRVT